MNIVFFVLVLALGTGLSTANLGTLSRYRAPMMPFFLLLLIILREPEKAPAPSPALPAPPPEPIGYRRGADALRVGR